MNERERPPINLVTSGVPGLDEVLGGGFPEFSLNVIAGGPGSGKTTLAHQMIFANARAARRSLYVTIMGEPLIKMMRYQNQFSFFDPAVVGDLVRFINLNQEAATDDFGRLFEKIMSHVRQVTPDLVVIDSFRSMVLLQSLPGLGKGDVRVFLQRLTLALTSWHTTTFLLGEYMTPSLEGNPVLSVSDGILWLEQSVERNSMVRKLEVVKGRGMASMPGMHTFRITGSGMRVYPRMHVHREWERLATEGRVSTGVAGLDEMMGGGIPAGDSLLIAGPSGSGKTVLCLHFITEGVRQGEPGVIAVFEEHPPDYIHRARMMGFDLQAMVDQGLLRIIYVRPLDLSVDETSYEIMTAVEALKARRITIDSLSGFELALAPTWRGDFREALYRMVGQLTGGGRTVLMTVEITESYTDLSFSPHAISFLSQDVLLQRYVEIEGRLVKIMTVIKMRGSPHSKDIRAYQITSEGLVMGEVMSGYQGLLSGRAEFVASTPLVYPGLTAREGEVLDTLHRLGEITAERMAEEVGMRPRELRHTLDRLVELNYVLRARDKEGYVYRPVARVLRR